MTKSDEIKGLLSESRQLAINGNMEEAARLSGETLALADNLIRNDISKEALALFAEATDIHADTLRCLALGKDSFSLCIMALSQISFLKNYSSLKSDIFTLSILCNAFACYILLLENNPPDSDDVINHGKIIGSYLLSLIYHSYGKCNNEEHLGSTLAALPVVKNAFNIIRKYSSMIPVQSPSITVNGKDVSPESDSDIYADIAGRSLAINFLSM